MRTDPDTTLPISDMRKLLHAARKLRSPAGNAIELAILTVRRPHEVLALDLGYIDWGDGVCRLPDHKVVKINAARKVILSNEALSTIHRIAGSATGAGQAVTAGRGKPIGADALRLDRLQTQIAKVWPGGPPAAWSFHAIRMTGARTMFESLRHPNTAVNFALGHGAGRFTPMERFTGRALHLQAKAALDAWADLLSRE